MEFEELKSQWAEMSGEIKNQKKLTESLIIKMTKMNYRNKLGKILIPEAIGACICFAAAIYILFSFQNLDGWYLKTCGIISVIILFLIPILSFHSIHNIRSVNIPDNNYKQFLLEYSKGKLQFVFIQKLIFYLGALLFLTALPMMARLIAGKDLFTETRLWLWYAIGYPFFYGFSRWVFKKYIKTTVEAEDILRELENN